MVSGLVLSEHFRLDPWRQMVLYCYFYGRLTSCLGSPDRLLLSANPIMRLVSASYNDKCCDDGDPLATAAPLNDRCSVVDLEDDFVYYGNAAQWPAYRGRMMAFPYPRLHSFLNRPSLEASPLDFGAFLSVILRPLRSFHVMNSANAVRLVMWWLLGDHMCLISSVLAMVAVLALRGDVPWRISVRLFLVSTTPGKDHQFYSL
jgi:hypothetical protein